jgi:hypothetical protein
MDKLYYIVCDDKDTTLFEGRYQGRTRGGALKFLKQAIGRKTLNGLVFTITEIPVPMIREIVADILSGGTGCANIANVIPITQQVPEPAVRRCEAFADAPTPDEPISPTASSNTASDKPAKKAGNPGHGDDYWSRVRAYWYECRSIKQTAEQFGLSPNSVKTRAYREGWQKLN